MAILNKVENQMMKTPNVVSVSWGDHLTFGEGDGRLATLVALQRRMECWRDESIDKECHQQNP